MINKSKAASLLVALFAATALAACGGNGSSSAAASSSKAASSTATSSSTAKSSSAASSSSSTAASSSSAAQSSSSTTSSSAPAVDIPTKADNFTFYFHFKASDTVKSLETWTSPYIDGVFNSWNAHPGVEMKALTGTDIYYAFVEKTAVNWATNANDLGYQLCLGYNSTSGVGESMQGVAGYTYKSDFSTLFSGTSHPVWATKGAAVPTSDLIDLRAYEFGDDSHVWTGEGNDYMLSGEEFCRSKGRNSNSYNASYTVNELNYALKITNAKIFASYQKLIALKTKVDGLHLDETGAQALEITTSGDNEIVLTLKDATNGKTYKVVHANGYGTPAAVDFSGYSSIYLDTLASGVTLSSSTAVANYQTLIAEK